MIRIIYGARGTGKTRKIIDEANERVKTSEGEIIFICDKSKYMYDLVHDVKFLDSTEYDISTETGLVGFIRGLIAANGVIDSIYIDGANRMMQVDFDEMEPFFELLERVSKKVDIEFVLTISSDILPNFMEKFKESVK